MSQESRFTAWLNPIERKALELEAEQQHSTMNFVLRMALREYLGKDALYRAGELVTGVTRNK